MHFSDIVYITSTWRMHFETGKIYLTTKLQSQTAHLDKHVVLETD